MFNTAINIFTQGKNSYRLLEGLGITLRISIISVLFSVILGVIFGLFYAGENKIIKRISRIYLEFFRIIPILVWLFLFYFGLPKLLNLNIPGELSAILVFILWGTAEMGDLTRAAIESMPKHQVESAKALGLKKKQIYIKILLPQAVKPMLPGAINLATRMIKTTSIVIMVGVVDMVKVSQQIIENNILTNPDAYFWVYGLVFILYFFICYPLSKLSKNLELKWRN